MTDYPSLRGISYPQHNFESTYTTVLELKEVFEILAGIKSPGRRAAFYEELLTLKNYILNLPSGGGGSSVTISDIPPSASSPGDLWWESDTGKLFVWYDDGTSAQWVEATGSSALPVATTTDVLTGIDATKAVTADALAALWEKGTNLVAADPLILGEGGLFVITGGPLTINGVDFAIPKDGRRAILILPAGITFQQSPNLLVPVYIAEMITSLVGDMAEFIQRNGDQMQMVSYLRSDGTTLFKATVADVLAGTDANKPVTPATYAAGMKAGFRNLLINPYGLVGQRGDSLTVADDAYMSADRWYALTQTSTALSGYLGIMELATGQNYWWLYQSQATAQRIGGAQIIEGKNCKHLRGRSVTLSGRANFTVAANVRYAILEWTGTEDVVTSDVVLNWASTAYTNGNFFIADANLVVRAVGVATAPGGTNPFNLTPLTATLGTTFNNLIVFIWTEAAAAQASRLDGALQFEEGAVATPREQRPHGVELAMCQRYYEVFENVGGVGVGWSGNANTGVQYVSWGFFKTRKRAVPTVVLTHINASSFPLTSGAGGISTYGITEGRIANATSNGAFFHSSAIASCEL